MNDVLHLVYSSDISKISEINSSFDGGILKVAYAGANRNGSFISKEDFERNITTAYNCPIVCHYIRDDDSIGGHDVELVKKANGDLRIVNATQPVGVIPESADYHWEEITEDDGTIHEYLCIDALLWKRQEAYEKIKENGIVSESMEITVKDGHVDKDSGLYIINDFEFTAFCLLGDGIEPCFEQAAIETFSYTELKSQINEMLSDLKTSFSITAPQIEADIKIENYAEGGNEKLDEKMELIAKYGLTVEALDFSIEDFSLEELEAKLKEFAEVSEEQPEEQTEKQFEEQVEEAEEQAEFAEEVPAEELVEEPSEPEEHFELSRNIRIELGNALKAQVIHKPWGEECKYWLEEFDSEKGEAYCRDTEDWLVYKFAYVMDGDKAVIDFESKKRVKAAYVDFVEGEAAEAPAMFSYFEEKYQSVITPLQEFEANTKAAEAAAKEKAAQDEVFAQFEKDLDGVAAFEELKQNCSGVGVEELEEKCFALKGKYGVFSLEQKSPRLPVNQTGASEIDNEPYNGLFVKYGFSAK